MLSCAGIRDGDEAVLILPTHLLAGFFDDQY